jgi:hypothetical protein
MKVVIGPYKNWIGPYQIADFIFGNPEKYVDDDQLTWRHRYSEKLGDWLSTDKHGNDSRFLKLCQWIESKRQRQVYVRIDRYDTWSMDHTLSYIIVPMLKQLQATKHGAPNVDDEDVPEPLRSTAPGARDRCEEEWDLDDYFFERWDWVLGEMIWAFEQQLDDEADSKFYDHGNKVEGESLEDSIKRMKVDEAGLKAWQDRKRNGYRLFGKYYEALWD